MNKPKQRSRRDIKIDTLSACLTDLGYRLIGLGLSIGPGIAREDLRILQTATKRVRHEMLDIESELMEELMNYLPERDEFPF